MMRGPIVAIALVTATCLAAGEPASSARDPVRWRHIAIEHALGNAATSEDVVTALRSRETHPSDLVREHVRWALTRHGVR